MKKFFVLTFMAMSFAFVAFADETLIAYDALPQSIKAVVEKHFAVADVQYVTMERNVKEYEVRLSDNRELDFDGKGTLKKVDCGKMQVPDALVPDAVHAYVKSNFSNAFITEWQLDDRRWKAELNNGLELVFNKKYEFIGIDD